MNLITVMSKIKPASWFINVPVEDKIAITAVAKVRLGVIPFVSEKLTGQHSILIK